VRSVFSNHIENKKQKGKKLVWTIFITLNQYMYFKKIGRIVIGEAGKRHRFSESKNNCSLIEPSGYTKARLLYGHFINQYRLY